MRLSNYPKYRSSDVGWIGDIPDEWHVKRLKFLVTICNGRDQKDVLDDENGTYNIYGSGGPFGKATSFLYDKPSVLLGRKGTIDKPLLVDDPFWTVDTMYYTKITDGTDLRFFFYLCCCIPFEFYRDQTTLPSMTQTGLGSVPFTFPSFPEQRKIADFLDWKTGQIDDLISKKKQLIEKLKEKRMALITQAVTKGLNPDAPMRDSGILWLGEVPLGWEVKPVKYLTRIMRGQFSHRPRNDPAYYDGEYPFVQTGDIARAGKYVSDYSQTLNDLGLSVSKQFPAGTLVMTIAANIGDMAIIEFEACFPDSIVGFVPEPNIDLHFLYYMFVAMKQRLLMTAVLNTQLNLNIDRIGSIETIEPPLSVQQEIVKFLDQSTFQIDALIIKNEQLIEKLAEYRTALITAATTGKVDVRNVRIGGAA